MRFLKRVLILLLVPPLLVAAMYAYVLLRSPSPASAPLVRTCDRKVVWKGDVVEARLHFNGDRLVTPASDTTPAERYMVMLLIDHSGSMGSGPGSPLESAKMAAAYYARVVTSPERPVGAISFDDGLRTVAAIGPDGEACAASILSISDGGGTDIAGALVAGHRELTQALADGGPHELRGLMILLSDGQSEQGPALDAARQAKDDGLRIITIGLGSQINQELLRQVASVPNDFFHTFDADSLGDIYMGIAGQMMPVLGRVGELTESYHYGAFSLERPPDGFRVEIDEGAGRFSISLPVLFAQRVSFPYRLRARKVGLYGLGFVLKPALLSYLPDPTRPDDPAEIATSLMPPILVLSPLLFFWLYLPLIAYLLWRLLDWLLHERRPEVEVAPMPPAPPRVPLPLPVADRSALAPRRAVPTLFAGIGDAGSKVVQCVAELLSQDTYLDDHPPFHLLQVDSRKAPPPSPVASPLVTHRATLPGSVAAAVDQLAADRPPDHLRWLPMGEVREAAGADTDLSMGSKGRRWTARLALFQALAQRDHLLMGPYLKATAWLAAQKHPLIVLIGSLESGTGSGLLTDWAYLLRAALPVEQQSTTPVLAIGLADMPADHGSRELNQQAFLEELDRLLVAHQVPCPLAYDQDPPEGLRHLRGATHSSLYDWFIIHQSPTDRVTEVSGVLNRAAAIAHTLSEQSLAGEIVDHSKEIRAFEERVIRENLEGTVSTASILTVRFPLLEIRQRLVCRFIMEVLGNERLVGAELGPDGKRLNLPASKGGTLRDALAVWDDLGEPPPEAAAYRAFCQAAAEGDVRTLRRRIRQAFGTEGPPDLEALKRAINTFAPLWFERFLNGPQELSDTELARWRRHRISQLYAVLRTLVDYGRDAFRNLGEQQPTSDTASTVIAGGRKVLTPLALISEIDRFHRGLLKQTREWLGVLLEPGCTGGDTQQSGLYRKANDLFLEIDDRLRREDEQSWQTVLHDETGNPDLREEKLYDTLLRPLLEQEHGFLLRWIWQLEPAAAGGGIPQLVLRLVTDQDRHYEPTEEVVDELFKRLSEVVEAACSRLDHLSVLDKLRGVDGVMDLDPLARLMAQHSKDAGACIDRHYPNADRCVRKVMAMVPDLERSQINRFHSELQRLTAGETTVVPCNDPYTVRLVAVESVVPIGALRLRNLVRGLDLQAQSLPFVAVPEREAEELRRAIETRLGRVPSPKLHPLVRLLVAAPMARSDWIGLIAEGCLVTELVGARLSICDAGDSEPVVESYQRTCPFVWALVNLAYQRKGVSVAARVLERWRQRSRDEQIELMAAAAVACEERGEDQLSGVERKMLDQIILIIRLEEDLARQRREEDR